MNIFDLNPVHITRIIAAEKRGYPKGYSFSVKVYRDNWDNLPYGFYTLFYNVRGQVEYIFEDKKFTVNENEIMFLDRYHPFTFQSPETGFEVYLINFVAESGFIDEPQLFIPTNRDKYLSIFKEASAAFKSNRPGFELMTTSAIMKLLANIKNDLFTAQSSNKKMDKVIFAIEHMKSNISNDFFSIDSLALEMNVSTSYLRNIFVEFCGVPPIKYFKKMRILHAADILMADTCSVSETAQRCGYNDVSYFCRDFKKILGTSPLKFKSKK